MDIAIRKDLPTQRNFSHILIYPRQPESYAVRRKVLVQRLVFGQYHLLGLQGLGLQIGSPLVHLNGRERLHADDQRRLGGDGPDRVFQIRRSILVVPYRPPCGMWLYHLSTTIKRGSYCAKSGDGSVS